MCYTCGCKMPYEDHGDPKNIVERNLNASTETEAAGGADVAKVKENVAELLRLEKEAGELDKPKEKYE